MVFATMEKYSIHSVAQFKATWTRAQLYLAMDSAFWNNPKERKDYSTFTQASLKDANADTFFKHLGFPV